MSKKMGNTIGLFNKKSFGLIMFLGILTTAQPVHAKTLAEFQKDRENARIEADNIQAKRAQEAREQADRVKRERDEKDTVRQGLVDKAKANVTKSGNLKKEVLTNELKQLKEQGRIVNRITWVYLEEQKKQSQRYSELIARFKRYMDSEAQIKDVVATSLSEAKSANSAQTLAPIREQLHKIYNDEKASESVLSSEAKILAAELMNTHGTYLRGIGPYSLFMNQYGFMEVPLPQASVSRLEGIETYAHQRGRFIVNLISQKLPEIEKQMDQMINAVVSAKMETHNNKNVKAALNSSFAETVGSLLTKKTNVFGNKGNQSEFGCRTKLKAQFELYREVLTFKDECIAVKETGESSPYFVNCTMLEPLIEESKAFFEKSAWSKMNLTLISAKKNAPKAVASLVKKLGDLKAQKSDSEVNVETLAGAIRVHDELLDQWKKSKSSEEGSSL